MSGRDNLKDRAYKFLRDAIISGELADGSQHSVYRLAAELGMSRTPVREAVLQLAEVGLVSVERNRGIRIHGTTLKKLREIFELRMLLEAPAAFHAATYNNAAVQTRLRADIAAMTAALAQGDEEGYLLHDRAFHDHIAEAVGNHQLCLTLDGLRQVIRDPWSNYGVRDPQEVIDEHVTIADAISDEDAIGAAGAMREHLVRTGTILLDHLAERMGEPTDHAWSERMFIPYTG